MKTRWVVFWEDVDDYDECRSLSDAVQHASFIHDGGSGTVDKIHHVEISEEDGVICHRVMSSLSYHEAKEIIAEWLDAEKGSVLHS